MRKILRWWLLFSVVSMLLTGLYMLLRPQENPRNLVLGEWREQSARVRVEVLPAEAHWRGAGHGVIRYEWLQTEKSPYRVRLEGRGKTVEADVSFAGNDRMLVEPDVWDLLPTSAQKMLGDVNRQHGRAEREFRLLLRRENERK